MTTFMKRGVIHVSTPQKFLRLQSIKAISSSICTAKKHLQCSYMDPVYNIIVPLQCRWVRFYVVMEYQYYSRSVIVRLVTVPIVQF